MTKIAGDSNEIITVRSIEKHGLNEGEHFQNIASESGTEDMPGDLRVTTEEPGVDPLNIR